MTCKTLNFSFPSATSLTYINRFWKNSRSIFSSMSSGSGCAQTRIVMSSLAFGSGQKLCGIHGTISCGLASPVVLGVWIVSMAAYVVVVPTEPRST